MRRKVLFKLLLGVFFMSSAALAQDGFYVVSFPVGVGTKITSLPYTILNPGYYYLKGELSTTGNGITINSHNVTIDLMGYSLAGNRTSGMHGININGYNNVEVRNGTVRNFDDGIRQNYSLGKNCRIVNIRALSNRSTGIRLLGNNHQVQNCLASDNDGNGIMANGVGAAITGNVINGNGLDGLVAPSGNLIGNVVYDNGGYGFNVSTAESFYCVIDRNTVYQNTAGNLSGVPPNAVFGVNAGVP